MVVMGIVPVVVASMVMAVIIVRIVGMVLDRVLTRVLGDILFRMLRVPRFHGLSFVLVANMLMVIRMVGPVVVGSLFIMPVVAHLSASCWRECVSPVDSGGRACRKTFAGNYGFAMVFIRACDSCRSPGQPLHGDYPLRTCRNQRSAEARPVFWTVDSGSLTYRPRQDRGRASEGDENSDGNRLKDGPRRVVGRRSPVCAWKPARVRSWDRGPATSRPSAARTQAGGTSLAYPSTPEASATA
jgi:hypothetical protein